MKFDGIIFDLDGTLWDSCRTVAESWGLTLTERFGLTELPTAADVAGIMGLTEEQIADKIFARYGRASREICRACCDGEPDYLSVHGGDIYPGTAEMLEELSRKAKLFIVSNCQDGYVQSFLAYSSFGRFFTDIECAGRTGLDKSDNLRLLIERNGLKAPVYVGDTMGDYRSCVEAGVPFIHASYGFGQVPDVPSIASFEELPDLIKKLPF